MTASLRLAGPEDAELLADIFKEIDDTYLHPHPFTDAAAHELAHHDGPDVYALLVENGRAIAYGMLRGWDEGYLFPTLGIAVRTSLHGRGYGRLMMEHLHDIARGRGCPVVRLKVHPGNTRARLLYESMGYVRVGEQHGEIVMIIDVQDPEAASRATDGARVMNGRLLEPNAPEWADVLARTRHDFYHEPAYVELSATQEGGRAAALHVAEGASAMLVPVVVRDIDGGGIDLTSPYGYPGPLFTVADESFVRLALAAGRHTLQAEGAVSAFLRLHPLLNTAIPAGLAAMLDHGETVSVDLRLSDEQRWSQLRTNHRRDITRAQNAGWAARIDTTWEHLETFKRLYRATMVRHRATAFYSFDDAYFDSLRAGLGDGLALCVVERDGLIAAAGLFAVTGDIAEYHLSGTDEDYVALQPLKLMLLFASSWARGRGASVMHLGGGVGASRDSLLHFKLGFSRTTHPFRTLRMVLDVARYRELVRARDPGLDSRGAYQYFPLYRLP